MNASSVLGRDVIDALASDDRGWMSELRLFGAPEDTFVHFDGQDIDIRPFTVDAFKGVDIAIGGADREVAAGAVAVRVGAEAPVVLPELNAQAIDEHRGTVFVPDGPSAAIALTANALGDQLQRITATVLLPERILGPKAIYEIY